MKVDSGGELAVTRVLRTPVVLEHTLDVAMETGSVKFFRLEMDGYDTLISNT